MCGIVGVASNRNSSAILVEGLRRLEYRGYDSAGLAVIDGAGQLHCSRAVGKVSELEKLLLEQPLVGTTGIAHTRWATHGIPSEHNAHPHVSEHIAVVHNGIIENHAQLRAQMITEGYHFSSQTDTEVVAHLMHFNFQKCNNMLAAFEQTLSTIEGAYALCVVSTHEPSNLYIARQGSPLVIGLGIEENFVASDQLALKPVTDRFVFLQEGDYGIVSKTGVCLKDKSGAAVTRDSKVIEEDAFDASKGEFKHFMLKEIYEQPAALRRTLDGRLTESGVDFNAFGAGAEALFRELSAIQIVACGTSYHSGLLAKYWLEEHLGLPVMVEIASEYRYRNAAVLPNALFITISQSGETADTLAALIKAKHQNYAGYLAICNVDNSSLVRESNLALLTKAGPEIGVASTKAFTTQLAAFLLLLAGIAQAKSIPAVSESVVTALRQLPLLMENLLSLDAQLKTLSAAFANRHHALFLGRGSQYPVAMEGALKLKEISYIHAEAYAAGELKHGPLALVDEDMPVIAVAPNNDVLDKVKSNLEEVKARGGKLYVFADVNAGFVGSEAASGDPANNELTVINIPHVPDIIAPIIYSLPLQLLSYYVAIVKGTDVDQPRNLAKSVTVE